MGRILPEVLRLCGHESKNNLAKRYTWQARDKEPLYAGKGGAAKNLLAAGNQQAMNDKRCQTTRYPGDRSGICVEKTSGAVSRFWALLKKALSTEPMTRKINLKSGV